MTLVSAYEFYKLSNWSYCPYYTVKLEPKLIKLNDIVFLNLDWFSKFMYILNNNPPNNKFILIIHNSYHPFNPEHFQQLFNVITHIYTINCNVISKLVTSIPFGFADNKIIPHDLFQKIIGKQKEKNILLYLNFNVNKNKHKRIECLNSFINKSWVYKDQKIPVEEYYTKFYRSKYIILPEGISIDNHKIYTALFFNCIPIVMTSKMDLFYLSLPIIVVNSWSDITPGFLENNHELFYEKLIEWKKNNEWTTAKYWLNR
jgi:hypothetical protein